MSQNYKFKSLEIAKAGKETEATKQESNSIKAFETGETKTIDFILLDGTRQNFAYAHYLTAWIGTDKDSEKNERYIKIFFATHLVTIKGYCLDKLYNALINFSVKLVTVYDKRYLDMIEENETFVIDLTVAWKKDENSE